MLYFYNGANHHPGPSTLSSKAASQSPRPDKKGKRRERSSSRDASDARHSRTFLSIFICVLLFTSYVLVAAMSATPSNAASSLQAMSPDSVPIPLPASKPKVIDKDGYGLPILNLDGPPPPAPSCSPSKADRKREKRKRQREKKKAEKAQSKQADGGAATNQGEDSEDE